MARVLVIGAGIVGVTTAYYLRMSGNEVSVVDAHSSAASGASFANGAQLSYSKTAPLMSPVFARRLPLLWVTRKLPFSVQPGFDPDFIRWGLQSLRTAWPQSYAQHHLQVIELALQSRQAMHELITHHKLDFSHRINGKMHLYRERREIAAAARIVEKLQRHGFAIEILSPQQARAIEPTLENFTELAGASYCSSDEVGDCRRFAEGLVEVLQEMGVAFHWNLPGTGFLRRGRQIAAYESGTTQIEAQQFVSCMGADTARLLKSIGVMLPIYPMKGYSVSWPVAGAAPQVNLTDEKHRVVFARIAGQFRVAGLAEFSGYSNLPNGERCSHLQSLAERYFPQAADYAQGQQWSGLRPMTPNGVPVIGPSGQYNNLYLNMGHGMLGWTLAAGSAQRLAGLLRA